MAEAKSNIIPFAFEDNLVRAVKKDGEPWFVGKDVCEVLHIRDYHQALDRLDSDERGGCSVPTPSGEQIMIVISEPGCYRLIFQSRKPEAERFKRWLAHEILPQLRKNGEVKLNQGMAGEDELVEGSSPRAFAVTDDAVAVLRIKLDLVNQARRLFGHGKAQTLWHMLNLPHMYELKSQDGSEEGWETISMIGIAVMDGKPVSDLVKAAFEEDQHAAEILRRNGIICDLDAEGLIVSNAHPAIKAIIANGRRMTENRSRSAHWQDIRRLKGTHPAGRHRFGDLESRSTFVPIAYLNPSFGLVQ
jgi:prophage antirepressor-like protein